MHYKFGRWVFPLLWILVLFRPVCARAEGWTPLQVSLWAPVQVFSKYRDVHGLRLNLLYGDNRSVNGIDIGLCVNKAEQVTALQVAGLGNIVQDDFGGIQVAGMGNEVKEGRITGLQVAGLVNSARDARGLQLAGLINHTEEKTVGLQMAPLLNISRKMSGIQIGIFNEADQAKGLQIGFNNYGTGYIAGLQLGVFCGSPFGGGRETRPGLEDPSKEIGEDVNDLYGLQAGLFCIAREMYGVQVGVFNVAGRAKGLQVGLVNFTERIQGLQIGAINVIREGMIPFFFGINFGTSF